MKHSINILYFFIFFIFFIFPNSLSSRDLCDCHEDIDLILKKISEAPSWIVTNRKNIDERRDITNLYIDISGYETSLIRRALDRLLKESNSSSYDAIIDQAKIFALYRILFNVTDSVSLDRSRTYGSWESPVDYESKTIDLLWPYQIGEKGIFELYGEFGFYTGPPYDALAEFDYLLEEFGRRKNINEY